MSPDTIGALKVQAVAIYIANQISNRNDHVRVSCRDETNGIRHDFSTFFENVAFCCLHIY